MFGAWCWPPSLKLRRLKVALQAEALAKAWVPGAGSSTFIFLLLSFVFPIPDSRILNTEY